MAKYELRTTVWYEDNEEAADAKQQQAYVEDWAKLQIEHWHRSKVHLIIREGKKTRRYTCDVDGGPTHGTDIQLKRPIHQWPWMKVTELMPEEGQNIVVYNDEEDFMSFGMLRPADANPCYGDNGPFFHCYTNDGQEIGYFQAEFPHLWWRTIEKPINPEQL